MANKMNLRKVMMRKLYGDGGSLVGAGSTLLDSVGQNSDGTTNAGTSFLSGALKYGSMGAALGPIGAIGGGIVGGLVDMFSSQSKNSAIEKQKADNDMKYKAAEQNRTNSQIRLANTNVGSNTSYYGNGGRINPATGTPFIEHFMPTITYADGGQIQPISGGDLKPIAPNVQEAVGLKHSQGGINIQTPNNSQAQIEGGEVVKDNNEVFSDQIKTPQGITFAEQAKMIADSNEYKLLKGKIDVAKRVMDNPHSNEFAVNAAKREIEKNPDPLDALFTEQEQMKQQQQTQTAGAVNNMPQQSTQPIQDPQAAQTPQQAITQQNQQPIMAQGGTISKPALDTIEDESDAHRMSRNYGDFNMPVDVEQNTISPNNTGNMFQNTLNKLGNSNFGKLAPYIDNFVSAKNTANTPQLPQPTYINPAQYNTQYDISAPLAEMRNQKNAAVQGIYDNSANSNTARLNAAGIFSKGIDASNKLYDTKINTENELKNKQVQENQSTALHNAQMRDQFNTSQYQRSIGIQNQVNQNAANAATDFEKQNLEQLTKVKDQQALYLETQKYKDTGVLERADATRMMDLIGKGHTVQEAKEILELEKEKEKRSKFTEVNKLQLPVHNLNLANSLYPNVPNFSN